MSDPFTDQHTAIWTTLEAHNSGTDSFTALVPTANRVKMDTFRVGNFQTVPRAAVDPMVKVWLDAGRSQVICSSGTELATVWMFDIRMADERPAVEVFPVMWAVYRAMAAAPLPGSTIRSLTFSGLGSVRDCNLTTFDTKYSVFREETLKGWGTMWAYEIRSVFTTALLPPS